MSNFDWYQAAVGLPLGIAIGVITGVVTLIVLGRLSAGLPLNVFRWLLLSLLSLPTFWFGGPWVTARLMKDIDWSVILPWYVVALAITYFVIVVYPVLRLVIWVGRRFR